MSEQAPIHHIYDGIVEQDNRLPNWWLGILWGTILFAFGYWMYFGVFGIGADQLEEYRRELAALEGAKPPTETPLSDEALLALIADPAVVQKGGEAFSQTCASCHGAKGEGGIGPNLTDGFWIHGSKPVDIHRTIAEGAVEKGMPAWGRTLGTERVRHLTSYLLTMKGSNVAGGKAPQGEAEK